MRVASSVEALWAIEYIKLTYLFLSLQLLSGCLETCSKGGGRERGRERQGEREGKRERHRVW